MIGHIKLDRKILNWEWYTDLKTFHLFVYLILRANYKDGNWKGVEVKRGQVITGRLKISKDTGLTEREIRTCMNKLKTTNEITVKTTSKFSIVTICKYGVYQATEKNIDQENDQQLDQQTTNKRPTNDQQTTTNKKDNNIIRDIGELSNFVCYNVEEYISKDKGLFEKICMATGKGIDYAKKELHNYHLWLEKNSKYPIGKKPVAAGYESWLINGFYKNGAGGGKPIIPTVVDNLTKL